MKLIFLSDSFYSAHKGDKEILEKPERPYVCLTVRIDGHLFAIPFRHHIPHKHAFMVDGESGLDYTKAVLILKNDDISDEKPWINSKSFQAVKGKDDAIYRGMKKFLNLYRKARQYRTNPHYRYILSCTSLLYFDLYI